MENSKYAVRKYQYGWIVTRKTDGFEIYFENYDELLDFIKQGEASLENLCTI